MKLIVGLGNPGKQYEKTRHNIGFMAIDCYASQKKVEFKKNMQALYAEFTVNGEKIILLKPQSYMNLSGGTVRKYFEYFGFELSDVLIVYDDVDFSLGTFKVKRNGSSAGHNGIKDVINNLSTEEISRIRIGVSKNNEDIKDYVLKRFSKADIDVVYKILPRVCDAIDEYISNGLEFVMEKYNKKV